MLINVSVKGVLLKWKPLKHTYCACQLYSTTSKCPTRFVTVRWIYLTLTVFCSEFFSHVLSWWIHRDHRGGERRSIMHGCTDGQRNGGKKKICVGFCFVCTSRHTNVSTYLLAACIWYNFKIVVKFVISLVTICSGVTCSGSFKRAHKKNLFNILICSPSAVTWCVC